jgi:transketolase
MVATNLRLPNLTILYDDNRSQSRSLPIPNAAERFTAFGCDVIEVDGHDLEALKAALAKPAANTKAVIAHTEKGHGCPTLANNMFEWHRKSPTPEQLEQLMQELEVA